MQLHERAAATLRPFGQVGPQGVWATWVRDLKSPKDMLRRYAQIRVENVLAVVEGGKEPLEAVEQVASVECRCPSCGTPWKDVLRSGKSCPEC